MEPAVDRLAVGTVSCGGFARPGLRQRLVVGARGHAHRRQHPGPHELRKAAPLQIAEQKLQDDVAASGISPGASRCLVDHHRRRVGGRLALQDLDDGWQRGARCISAKAADGQAGGVGQDLTHRHRMALGEGAVRDAPALQLVVDGTIQPEPPFLGHLHGRAGCDRLAVGTGLVERARRRGPRGLHVGETIGLGPHDAALIDHRYAERRDVMQRHFLGERMRRDGPAANLHGRRQAGFDVGDVVVLR